MGLSADLRLARRAKKHGANYSLRIVQEARRAGVSVSLAFALVEQESGFRNVFGHDPVRNPVKGGRVTLGRYRAYKRYRKAGLGMQGVGPCQLTWYATQDQADAEGGCHRPAVNIRVALRTLKANIAAYGKPDGIRRYNGAGPAAEAYSRSVRAREKKWHARLA